MREFDAAVFGGGPAGMTAALYLVRAGINVAMIEKLSPGGQMLLTSEIENYPGFPEGLQGWELSDLMAKHFEHYGASEYPHERIMDEVKSIETGNGYHDIVMAEETIRVKAAIFATGAKYKNLCVPGEERLMGRGVSYCALCDGNFYRDMEVAVIGGGNSALEEALYLARICSKVHLIHRRDDFRGAVCYQNKCFTHEKIEVHRSSVVEEVNGDSEVKSLTLKNVKTGETSELEVPGVFIFVGFDPVMEYVPDEVEKNSNGIITDVEMNTNIRGLFAAGDIRSKNCRQVASAVGDGATAATAAITYIEQLGE